MAPLEYSLYTYTELHHLSNHFTDLLNCTTPVLTLHMHCVAPLNVHLFCRAPLIVHMYCIAPLIVHMGGTSQDVKRIKNTEQKLIFTVYTLGFLDHLHLLL